MKCYKRDGEPYILPKKGNEALLLKMPGDKVAISTDDCGGFADGVLKNIPRAGNEVIMVELE